MKGRQQYRIERLLRRGMSKDGTISHLSYRDLTDEYTKFYIDTIFDLILSEGNHVAKQLLGKSKSDILFLKPEFSKKDFRINKFTEL